MTSFRRFYFSTFTIALLFFVAQFTSAQVRTPRPSQKASVMQTIGVTDVTITYSRPGVKGRKIWGDALPSQEAKGEATLDDQNARPKGAPIVPWGHAWRTGNGVADRWGTLRRGDVVTVGGCQNPRSVSKPVASRGSEATA